MKSVLLCLVAVLWAHAAVAQPNAAPQLSAVINEIKREIGLAQATPGASVGLSLEKVEVVLLVARTLDANGKLSISVPTVGEASVGGSRKAEESSSISVELVPPKPTGVLSGATAASLGLAEAIIETRRQLLKGLNDEPKLEARKVVINVKFGVTTAGTAGGQLKFAVVGAGVGGGVSAAENNSVTLTFSRSRAP